MKLCIIKIALNLNCSWSRFKSAHIQYLSESHLGLLRRERDTIYRWHYMVGSTVQAKHEKYLLSYVSACW